MEYADGNRHQAFNLVFESEPIGGELCITDETSEFGYFSLEQIQSMDVMEADCEKIADALVGQKAAFVR